MSRGVPSHARVEVTHTCCDPDGQGRTRSRALPRASNGVGFGRSLAAPARPAVSRCRSRPSRLVPTCRAVWHYLQPGSGIFFDVGRTFVGAPWEAGCAGGGLEATVACLRDNGFDSWQFPHVYELGTKLFEVVNVRDTHAQVDGCFDTELSRGRYFRGWDATQPCRCAYRGSGWWRPMNCDADG